MNKLIDTKITELQGYCLMVQFLDYYYFETYADDVGALLGGMHFLQDGKTADPAFWEDWIEGLYEARGLGKRDFNDIQKVSSKITLLEAYCGMLKFLEEFSGWDDIGELLKNIQMESDCCSITDTPTWKKWVICLEEILAEKDLIDKFLLRIGPKE